MGVDYYNCDECGEIFDDCSGMYNYCEECGKRLCFWCQVELNMRTEPEHFQDGAETLGEYWSESGWTDSKNIFHKSYTLTICPYCCGEVIDDETIMEYLLNKVNMQKSEVVDQIKKTK